MAVAAICKLAWSYGETPGYRGGNAVQLLRLRWWRHWRTWGPCWLFLPRHHTPVASKHECWLWQQCLLLLRRQWQWELTGLVATLTKLDFQSVTTAAVEIELRQNPEPGRIAAGRIAAQRNLFRRWWRLVVAVATVNLHANLKNYCWWQWWNTAMAWWRTVGDGTAIYVNGISCRLRRNSWRRIVVVGQYAQSGHGGSGGGGGVGVAGSNYHGQWR